MSTDTTIHLLRHGEVVGGKAFRGSTDVALTDNGWQQMLNAVANLPLDVIVSSPLTRCSEFAHKHAKELAKKIHIEPRLQEIHFGDWEDKHPEQVMQEDAQTLKLFWEDPWNCTPPGAESLVSFQQRVLNAWHHMLETFRGQHLLVVTHGGVIRILLSHVYHHPREQLLQLDVDYASLHTIQT